MRKLMTSAALVIVLGVAGSAWAQCCSKDKAKAKQTAGKSCCGKCDGAKKVADKSCCGTCGGAKKVASKSDCSKSCATSCATACCAAPKMTFKVAGESLCCPQGAEKLAKEKDAKIVYVVGTKDFASKGKAMTAYATALEQHLDNMGTVKMMAGGKCTSCPMTAEKMAKKAGGSVKYCVASFTFDNREDAEKAAKKARNAAQQVKMTMTVDGKPYTCDKAAAAACDRAAPTSAASSRIGLALG